MYLLCLSLTMFSCMFQHALESHKPCCPMSHPSKRRPRLPNWSMSLQPIATSCPRWHLKGTSSWGQPLLLSEPLDPWAQSSYNHLQSPKSIKTVCREIPSQHVLLHWPRYPLPNQRPHKLIIHVTAIIYIIYQTPTRKYNEIHKNIHFPCIAASACTSQDKSQARASQTNNAGSC